MNQKIKNDAQGAELKTQVNVTTIEQNLQAPSEIPPYKLKIMLKYASKIYDQIMDIPQFSPTYSDAVFILESVLYTVEKAREVTKS